MTRRWGRAAVAAACCVALGLLLLPYAGCQAGRPGGLNPLAAAAVAARAPAPVDPTLTLAAPTTAVAAPSTAAGPARPSSYEAAAFPVPIVELRGKPADLGAAHGRRLATQIHALHDGYLNRFIRSGLERFVALAAADAFRAQITPAYRDEVAALADGAGMDARSIMLGQCFLDLMPVTACSTVTLSADAAPDGVARFGRNLDFYSANIADKYSVFYVYHPDDGYAFASVGWPGMVGVLSGMNEHGLAIANMEVARPARLPQAMPYTLLYRTILEQCRTTDEALALLERTPRQSANNLMIMDAAGDRAVAEITPEGVTVRRPDEFALISTNHRRGQDNASPGRCGRYDYLRDASERYHGRIDVGRLESMLGTVSQGRQTLQSMVFELSNRVIYLSAGADAAHGEFHRLDLTPYFRRQADAGAGG